MCRGSGGVGVSLTGHTVLCVQANNAREDLHCKPGVSLQALMASDCFYRNIDRKPRVELTQFTFIRPSSESGNDLRVREDVRLRGRL